MSEIPLILSLDVAGNPQRWITYEDVAYYKSKGLVLWEAGGDDYRLHGGTSRMTGEQSTLDINTIVALRGKMLSQEQYARFDRPTLSNKALFRRDAHLCAYCGQTYTSDKLTRDHVHPTSRGGRNVWENVVTSCKGCNHYKDNHLLNEIGMELLYIPYVPNRAEWLILTNRNILADQMEFLLSRVGSDSRLRREQMN
jgi:hypothetical protein